MKDDSRLSSEYLKNIFVYESENGSDATIVEFGLSRRSLNNYRVIYRKRVDPDYTMPQKPYKPKQGVVNGNEDFTKPVNSDKKLPEYNWREWCKWIKDGQQLHKKSSFSQDFAKIDLGDVDGPICIANICDWHIGAHGTDYELLEKYTDEIINTPNLYIVLTGDMLETAIKLRGVKEVAGQIIEPEQQINFLASWLEDVKDKVLWATWDNHTVQREENVTGFSVYKRIIGKEKAIIYHNGIGYVDLKVGEQTYHIVSSHKFIGRSYLNPTHGQQRYMRFEGQDREIAMSGDSHKVAFSWYFDGEKERLAINGGTLHTSSGYAKRYFSLFTVPEFPCLVVFPDEHLFIPYKNLSTWNKVQQNKV